MAPANADAAAQLRGVLGTTLGDREIKALVDACEGNVENALNKYFDRGMEAVHEAMKKVNADSSQLSTKKRRAPSNTGSGRLTIQDPSAKRAATSKRREWPKRLCSLAVDAESTTCMSVQETTETFVGNSELNVSVEESKPLGQPKTKRTLGSTAEASGKGKGRGRTWKKGRSTMVRIGVGQGCKEVFLGRLPKWISSRLHPLLVHGVVRATASIQAFLPEELRPFSQIPIVLHLDLLGPEIFSFFPDPKRSVDNTEPLAVAFFELCEVINNPLKYGSVAIGASGNLEFAGCGALDQGDAGSVLTLTEKDARGIEETLGVKNLEGTAEDPPGLSVSLRPHQRVALRWMLDREDLPQIAKDESLWQERTFRDRKASKYYVNVYTRQVQFQEPPTVDPLRGGILADEMGLGKTVSVIALILASNDKLAQRQAAADEADEGMECVDLDTGSRNSAEVDLVATTSTQSEEITLETSQSSTSCGKAARKRRRRARPGTLIVCPTSLIGQWEAELSDKVSEEARLRVLRFHGSDRNRGVNVLGNYDCVLTTYGTVASEFQNSGSDLFSTAWERVVLDEAHNVKNRTTDAARASAALEAQYRWCLTGTPLQNSVDDIYSLFLFLRYEPWNSYGWWSKIIRMPFEQQVDKEKSAAAMQRLRAVLSDGPVMLRRTKRDVEASAEASIQHKLPEKHLEVLYVTLSEAERAFYNAIYSRSKAEFDGFVSSGSANTKYAAIFTLLLRMRQACDHPFLVLSSHAEEDRASGTQADTLTPKAVSDREYIAQLRDRLFAAATVSTAAAAAAAAGTASSAECSAAYLESALADLEQSKGGDCPICLDDPKDAVITTCGHVMCKPCLESVLTYKGAEMACPVCRRKLSRLDINPLRLPSEVKKKKAEEQGRRLAADKALSTRWRSSSKLDLVLQHLQRIEAVNKSLGGTVWGSEALREQGEKFLGAGQKPANQAPIKVLIFSQWTKMLDMVERGLRELDMTSARLDGSLTQKRRQAAIDQFNTDPKCNIFLVSLKAGGVGLNLVRASVVFLVDAWWNPQIEEQAIDRVHRIGQTRPVHVYRLIATATVEQKILALQARKASMANDALQADGLSLDPAAQKSQKLSMEDLFDLFRSA
ncbi:DNA repair protein RAD5B [Hondaea fermentalgiana]|uniref:DNA repair protein RAD5B n=1 Tax=Hondaea fermentalgiana TaxID=2315210 RepID=A0A2R5GSP7_9STRA|nr:DNA repair protein RAD5B [Hondaea fermentalgiana]|eukprot:GBG30904.1 DNA repair protein RAD5B [Hondaea fermentalgiana]